MPWVFDTYTVHTMLNLCFLSKVSVSSLPTTASLSRASIYFRKFEVQKRTSTGSMTSTSISPTLVLPATLRSTSGTPCTIRYDLSSNLPGTRGRNGGNRGGWGMSGTMGTVQQVGQVTALSNADTAIHATTLPFLRFDDVLSSYLQCSQMIGFTRPL